MTFALTKARAFGIEVEEPRNKRYLQYLVLNITAANTDVDLDLGDHVAGALGTFWTAVDGSEPGDTALKAIRDIALRAEAFLSVQGTGLSTRTQEDASRTTVVAIDSAAAAGGSATEVYTVTGLLTTDSILSVTQFVDGAGAAVGILSYGSATGQAAANNALSVVYNADPGAGAKIRVVVTRASTAPEAGTYILSLGTMAPNILFITGDAPTALTLVLCWYLKDAEEPVSVYATSAVQSGS